MKIGGIWNWRAFIDYAENEAGAELEELIDGCLIDNRLYRFPDGNLAIALEVPETTWTSVLKVRYAESEGDNIQLYNEWNELFDEYEAAVNA